MAPQENFLQLMIKQRYQSMLTIFKNYLILFQCNQPKRISISITYQIIMRNLTRIVIILLLVTAGFGLVASGDIQLFPNTQNSPSIYLLPFSLSKAVPTSSYILVTMDWYGAAITPYNCILVNTSIPLSCTNLASPVFSLTITTAQVLKINPLLSTAKTVAIQVGSNLLANTNYALQLHLLNVIPNIKKITPSIEIYTISSNGLIYEANSNFGAVVNNPPITNLMQVSILNTLSANSPGSISALRAQITIGQEITTSLSTLIFVMQYPFTFSIGSIPTASQSSLYSTNPIPLYSAPTVYSYQVITPNVFILIFNEQFIVGRKFIVQISQINNPFVIASTNISIYSLNFNTLTPLEAFEMLYPIATVSYTLPSTLGLPYDAPIQGPMKLYRGIRQFVQVKVTIPYSVPDGYSIRMYLVGAEFTQGSAYVNFQSLTYTTNYKYIGNNHLVMSQMGPITIGTVVTVNFQIYVTTTTIFYVHIYIDTNSIISTFASTTGSKYVYYGLISDSGAYPDYNFFENFYDSVFGWGQRVASYPTINSGQWFYLRTYQAIDPIATSAGSYVDYYLSPNILISPTFDQNNDCRLYNSVELPTWTYNSCLVTITRTSTYLRLTIKTNSNYQATLPNFFSYQAYAYIGIRYMAFPLSASNKNVYPVYCSLYQGDVVNPITYHYMRVIGATPNYYSPVSSSSFKYISNFYSTSGASNLQTYIGAIRFESTNPAAYNSLIVQPNQQFTITFVGGRGFRSFPSITNMQSYPCTSNIPVQCNYYIGNAWGSNQIFYYDRIVVTFLDNSYRSTNFHIIIPDTYINQNSVHFYYFTGFYNQLTKDWSYSTYGHYYYRHWDYWISSPNGYASLLGADISGKAGAYRNNVSVTIQNNNIETGGQSFLFLTTQWSFFQNGVSSLTSATLAMSTPVTFGSNNLSPLSVYMTGGMYITVVPFVYVSSTSPFTLYFNNVHMPYTYDLPSYYIYVARQSDQYMIASNQYVMTNGGTLYQSPLQSLTISCTDNAIGVVSTYCTIVFGTSHPLLMAGAIRVSLSGLTVATNICYLTAANGTSIPVVCTSSSDNLNVTAVLQGSIGFYPAGTFTLVIYGVGILSSSLSQSMTVYLYDSSIQYVIQTGVRILMTTIASLSYISLNQIMYSYLNPLSYSTMTIQFSLPRMLYQDEQFAFVIGQDLSDVNTEPTRLNIVITRDDGLVLYPLFTIDNVNYLIIFSFTDPTQLTASSYVMTIYGICTPASQSNGAFNMIYRRTYDFTYTIVNSANVIFPSLNSLTTSNIFITSYYNTEGYKQQIDFSIVNSVLNVNDKMVWIINFPSYYSPQLFQQDAYCMIDTAAIPCQVDPNTPYQLIITNSPITKNAGVSYTISVIGLACPRNPYTNNAYPSRYIFIGVLQNSLSTAYSDRALLLPYQTIQSTVTGVVNVLNMVGISTSSLFSFSSIYAQFQLYCSVAINSGTYLYIDLPIQFNNLNNLALNVIIVNGATVVSTSATVRNRRIQILMSITIALKTTFRLQFPNLPTPKYPCTAEMSDMIVTVTPSNKLSISAASSVQGNSAPSLTFVANNKYISFNNDQNIVVTAGTYTKPISITASDNGTFLSNININLTSTGFTFLPSSIFLPIGFTKQTFQVGADSDLVPVAYFYQAIKQEEVNTNYQITLNMNIQVVNTRIPVTLPASLTMGKGGCTNPFVIELGNAPFQDVAITYTFDNTLYSQDNFFPNPLTTLSQMNFNNSMTNATFSFCSTTALSATQIPISFFFIGTNYNSYEFTPSNQITVNINPVITNTTPTVTLALKNQQKTFLDVNFTNNVDGTIFYQMSLGQNVVPLDLQSIQVYLKSNKWILSAPTDFMTHIYTVDVDNRIGFFFQSASTSALRVSNLIPQSFYTLCAYIVNNFGATSSATCIQLSTMVWGTVIKANLKFTKVLTPQQLNNVLCFLTLYVATSELYMVDLQSHSCGNRAVSNKYYLYNGASSTTQTKGTYVYLATNPYLTGTDPSPNAFMSLFNAQGQFSTATLAAAQSMFAINYMSGTYVTTYNARLMTSPSQASGVSIYFNTPTYDSTSMVLTVSSIQVIGNVGTVYFVLVLYKQIQMFSNGSSIVNIRMNYAPTSEQVLNCQNWEGTIAQGCGRVVYSGVAPLTLTFSGVQANSLYMLYYVYASEFPLRPIVSGQVQSQTVVTYTFQKIVQICLLVISVTLLLMI